MTDDSVTITISREDAELVKSALSFTADERATVEEENSLWRLYDALRAALEDEG